MKWVIELKDVHTGLWRRVAAFGDFRDKATAYQAMYDRWSRNPDVEYRVVIAIKFFVMARDLTGEHKIALECFSNRETALDFIRLRAAKLNLNKNMYKIVEVNED